VPKPQATAIPDTAVTEDAMPAAESDVTAVPTPEASGPPDGGAGRGLSLGGPSANQQAGIPADFHFTYYVERMLALIESRWYKPAVPPNTTARVRFRIRRDGRVDGIVLEESSKNSSFDRAALRALYAANPLPPLPPAYGKPTLTVHLAFSE
jgi:protein TonB